jgi:hypothetical protein
VLGTCLNELDATAALYDKELNVSALVLCCVRTSDYTHALGLVCSVYVIAHHAAQQHMASSANATAARLQSQLERFSALSHARAGDDGVKTWAAE